MYKKDFALDNLQSLMCHKTKPNQTKIEKAENMLLITFCFVQKEYIYHENNDRKVWQNHDI